MSTIIFHAQRFVSMNWIIIYVSKVFSYDTVLYIRLISSVAGNAMGCWFDKAACDAQFATDRVTYWWHDVHVHMYTCTCMYRYKAQ